MRVLLLPLVFALTALAQPPAAVPEVRGTIVESGTNTPIPGVEVTISEFGPNAEKITVNKAVASTFTDAKGAYSLKPGHLGDFSILAKKEGYSVAHADGVIFANPERRFILNAATPVQNLEMLLTRPATITGRVIDRDGNPVPNLRVTLERAPARFPFPTTAPTDAEGIFTASNLAPGAYVVHIEPAPLNETEDLLEFNEAAFKIVDEDIEPAYFPGGVPNAELALPISVTGGAISNAGTLTVRKVPYYRVRITLAGDCAPNERWTLRLRPAEGGDSPMKDRYSACRKDALLTRVPPGSYNLAVWTGRSADRWALAPFIVTDKNTQTTLTFNTAGAVSGRVTAADGADVSKLGDVQILLRPANGLSPGEPYVEPDATGKFTYRVPWTSQLLSVEPADPNTFVKEIRLNGLPLRSQPFDTSPGATLDVVLDSGAAKLSVTLRKGEAITAGQFILIPASVTEPPRTLLALPPFSFLGGFQSSLVSSIPPGDYRILVLSGLPAEDFRDPNAIATLFTRAEKITLGRGEQKSIEIQVK